jgi:hypothetical protein
MNKCVLTPQEYKYILEHKCFKKFVCVEDLFVLPDYDGWLSPCGDKSFGHCYQDSFTQLQWVFTAKVDPVTQKRDCEILYQVI